MAGNVERHGGWRRGLWWGVPWVGAALILLLPLVAMQFTDEVQWSAGDFVIAGLLLFGTVLAYALIAGRVAVATYRVAVGMAVLAALLLVWINLAVGIVGSEDNPANLLYFGVLAVGIVGAALARLRPAGMARALLVTALAQAMVGMFALVVGWRSAGMIESLRTVALHGFFVVMFAGSALLFRRAGREQSSIV